MFACTENNRILSYSINRSLFCLDAALFYHLTFNIISMAGGILPNTLSGHSAQLLAARSVSSYPAGAATCETQVCKDTAYSILHDLDLNVDPCSDFYQYTCKLVAVLLCHATHTTHTLLYRQVEIGSRITQFQTLNQVRLCSDGIHAYT